MGRHNVPLRAASLAPPCPAAAWPWLDALPHASAVVALDPAADRAPAVRASNASFVDQFGVSLHRLDLRIVAACAAVLRGQPAPTSLSWDQGGFTGRIFDACVRRLDPPADGAPVVLLSLVDRTSQARSEATLRRELASDSLTGLPNRAGLGDMIERRLAAPAVEGKAVTLLIIDMLRFSRINESMGGLFGDELLITFARRLISALRTRSEERRVGKECW